MITLGPVLQNNFMLVSADRAPSYPLSRVVTGSGDLDGDVFVLPLHGSVELSGLEEVRRCNRKGEFPRGSGLQAE